MKSKFLMLIIIILAIISAIVPASAVETTLTQIDALEKEISSMNKEMESMDDGMNVIMGNVIKTSPYFLVKGYGMGTETFQTPAQYYIISDPQHGQTTGYFYSGPHKYLYTDVMLDEYGNKVNVTHVGSMPERWLELRLKSYEKEQQLKTLKAENGYTASRPVNDLAKYGDGGLTTHKIALQVGNPNMVIYSQLEPIDSENSTPVLIDGTTFLPIRGLIEGVGGEVEWDSGTQDVNISLFGNDVTIATNKNTAIVNGKAVSLVKPAQIINGRMMVPLRFVAENLGMKVEWINDAQVIVITYSPNWIDHMDSLLKQNANGDYEFNYGNISHFVYPKKWGAPKLAEDGKTFTFKSGNVRINLELIAPTPNEIVPADVFQDRIDNEYTVQADETTPGVVAVFYYSLLHYADKGECEIYCENGYTIHFYWYNDSLSYDDGVGVGLYGDIKGTADTELEILEVIQSISVDVPVG